MRQHPTLTTLAALFGATALLTACGGGSGDDTPAPPPPPVARVDVRTTVIDGAIGNALVCLDKNGNGACDADEPSGRTAADGTVTLSVLPADAGQHALLALVGTDAVDADHGAITLPFMLRAPADRTAVVSPLTTLVAAQADGAGTSSADAEAALKDQLGLDASLFADYTQGSGANATLAQLARLIVLTKAEAYDAVKSAEGTADASGRTITRADLDRVIDQQLVQEAQSVLAVLSSEAVRSAATGAQREAALQAAAAQLSAAQLAFDPAAAVAAIELMQAGAPSTGSSAGVSLRWFTYTDPANWYFRLFHATPEQAAPDANGLRRFSELRKRAVNGVVQAWGAAPDFTRTELLWNGTAWFDCPVDHEHTSTPFDASGNSETLYCDAYRGKSRRVGRDVAGAKMSDIVREIRAFPLHDFEGRYADWGPNPADPRLADLTFPAGAEIGYYAGSDIANPDAYRPADVVRPFVADVANGVASACSQVTGANSASFQFVPATLEQFVAALPGKPCVFGANESTGPRNEWWSNSTAPIGTVPGAAPAHSAYSANRSVRLAFGSGSSVTYYNCAVMASSGSSRNCDVVGTGSYTIEQQGDARVLRLTGVPADAAALTYTRVFVERGGKVHFGFRVKLRQSNSVRLNEPAVDALFSALGVSR